MTSVRWIPFLISACLSAGTISAQDPRTLSLAGAQSLLLSQNPDMRLEKLEVDRARAELAEARAAYWPSLDASASYQAFSKPNHIRFETPPPPPPPPPAPPPPTPPQPTVIDRDLGDRDREEYGIDLTYPLFGGGARRQQELSRKASLRASETRVRAQGNRLSLQLAALYCAWHAADAAARTQDTLVRLRDEEAAQVKALVKQGAALASQEASARARALHAQAEARAAADTRDSLSRAAALLLGLPPETPVLFAEGAFDAPDILPETAAAPPVRDNERAPERKDVRPDLAALDQTAEALGHRREGLMRQRFPSVHGMAGYRLANPGLNLGSDEYMHYGLVGLQVKWNLFDGFKNRSQRAQALIQQQAVETERARRESWWNEAVLSAAAQRERLALTAAAAQAGLEAARENLRETAARRARGTATNSDELEARAQEATARLTVRQVEIQQRLAEWQLRFARGETLVFSQGD
jgi:outer membrane protein TolC